MALSSVLETLFCQPTEAGWWNLFGLFKNQVRVGIGGDSFLSATAYYEARNGYTNNIQKQFSCVTDVCVIGKLIPREFFCVIGVYRKYHMEAPKLHKRIPARKLCVTDVLCN